MVTMAELMEAFTEHQQAAENRDLLAQFGDGPTPVGESPEQVAARAERILRELLDQ